jgi:hypothetical protein
MSAGKIASEPFSVWRELGYRLLLDPLGKLVDWYQYVGETTWRCCKWPNHIKAPTSKRPGWRYGDKIVSWDMRLLAKELAVMASPHQVLSIRHYGWATKNQLCMLSPLLFLKLRGCRILPHVSLAVCRSRLLP